LFIQIYQFNLLASGTGFVVDQFPVSQASDHVDMSMKMARASYDLPSSVVVSVPARQCLARVSC